MKKTILLLIVILAFILRFYKLGDSPSSLDWDEASLGYNAYSILKTGRDEYGNFLPIAIRSFDDYKPPLYTYLSILPITLLGLNEFSTRFISAFFGTLTIFIVYLLVKELRDTFFPSAFINKQRYQKLPFLVAFMLAISPWHLQFSRVAFEANLALFLFLVGAYLLIVSIRKIHYLYGAVVVFVLSLYSYHSIRLILPLFILGMTIILVRSLLRFKKQLIMAGILGIFSILPLFTTLFSGSALSRFTSVTAIAPSQLLAREISDQQQDQNNGYWWARFVHNRRLLYARQFLKGYLDHFNFDFLFLRGDAAARHHAAGFGMLYIWEVLTVILGIILLAKIGGTISYFVFLWYLIAPAASALTTGTPHAVRALITLPTYQIFTGFAIIYFLQVSKSALKQVGQKLCKALIILIILLTFYQYLDIYYIHTPIEYSLWWQYGYKQVVNKVASLQNQFDRIVVTYKYDQPYIYFLFYNKISPAWYQQHWQDFKIERFVRKFGKYEFRPIDWSSDKYLKNTLFVAAPGEIPENEGVFVDKISFLNNQPAFVIIASYSH